MLNDEYKLCYTILTGNLVKSTLLVHYYSKTVKDSRGLYI